MEKTKRRKGKRITVYYCHAYAPHECGSNENMNRLKRRFFPKGTSFDDVTIADVQATQEWINNYPRKILGWGAPRKSFLWPKPAKHFCT